MFRGLLVYSKGMYGVGGSGWGGGGLEVDSTHGSRAHGSRTAFGRVARWYGGFIERDSLICIGSLLAVV